ncbi:ubiquitin carboxyl-terminal hydrolase-like protein [Podospora didyma]|uniref:ubiquitinyl hydrolase 1 n=1 Tax=Podospora didyma TaxID=330526 RepID=A0AAE0NP05_9PEZI|nr:ubiquitin carboxyl-terminal hydrolase-like protein [Podospora didyma]
MAFLSYPPVRSEASAAPNQPGRLATRLIKDWFAGRMLDAEANTSDISWTCRALRDPFRRIPNAGPDHELVIIQSQSYDHEHDPEGKGNVLLSCMCRFCRHHFVFRISQGLCGSAETASLLHHFLPAGDERFDPGVEAYSQPAYQLYPTVFRAAYKCSECAQTVALEITLPRLKPEWIKMITDEARIRESLRTNREKDPERYRDISPSKEHTYQITPLTTLNQYLKNVLDDDGSGARKRISFRNKTFSIQFGPACEPIFRYLGFEVQYDEETSENYWLPPLLPPQERKTALSSQRAFYEDARSEVQSLLDESPPQSQPVVRPISSAQEWLEKALGCEQSHQRWSRLPVDNNETDDFRLLGAPVDSDDSVLRYAYTRQIRTDPSRKEVYLAALGRLAGRRDEELQMFVFKQQEDQTAQQPGAALSSDNLIDRAYAHFGLAKTSPEAAEYVINVYRTFREQSPAQTSDHRLNLLRIGKHRDSQVILDEVYKTKMDPQEACKLLNVDLSWPLESIAVTAETSVQELDLSLTIMALDAIAQNRTQDDPSRPTFEMILAKLRSQASGLDSLTATGAEQASSGVTDISVPVGLGNLRNTCYLNSILQYFYSVNAVRDVARSSDRPPLEPTEQAMQALLDGASATDIEPGRAFVGYEFSRELSALFRELDVASGTSVTPRQRLANAALLRPERLRARSATVAGVPGSDSIDAPPLPPRASQSSELKVTVDSVDPNLETASNVSSQTLVNLADEDPSYVVVGNNAVDAGLVDVEMTNGEDSSNSAAGLPNDVAADNSKLTVEELAAELDKPNVGSDQMDVDEVMGNAIDHLKAAFKVSRLGSSYTVPDPIEQAFFSTFIDSRKKVGEADWNRSTRSDRWATAFPAKSGPLGLYDALANSFDLEPLAPGLLTFTTIERPAPNFHICIQRSDGVSKNTNPIIIPETLYLDRFMHTNDSGSRLFKTKKRAWDVKTRLNEVLQHDLVEPVKGTSANGKSSASGPGAESFPSNADIDEFLMIEDSNIPTLGSPSPGRLDEEWSVLNSAISGIFAKGWKSKITVSPYGDGGQPHSNADVSTLIPPSVLDDFWTKFNEERADEKEKLMAERNTIFDGMQQVAYRLHAVVCHAGSTARAGHYWVWIHDFEQDVWRKYNDTRVSVHQAEHVFGELNTKGEPYYLAYVRAQDVDSLVSVPRRQPPATESQHQPQPTDSEMADAAYRAGAATSEHVEDASRAELPPYAA